MHSTCITLGCISAEFIHLPSPVSKVSFTSQQGYVDSTLAMTVLSLQETPHGMTAWNAELIEASQHSCAQLQLQWNSHKNARVIHQNMTDVHLTYVSTLCTTRVNTALIMTVLPLQETPHSLLFRGKAEEAKQALRTVKGPFVSVSQEIAEIAAAAGHDPSVVGKLKKLSGLIVL